MLLLSVKCDKPLYCTWATNMQMNNVNVLQHFTSLYIFVNACIYTDKTAAGS